jgi:hypothetical protein
MVMREECPCHGMPAVILMEFTQYWKGVAEKAFYIVIKEFAIDCHAPVFNITRRRLVIRIADMRGKLILPPDKFRRGFHG